MFRGGLAQELANAVCQDPQLAPLVQMINRTITKVRFCSFAGGLVLGLVVLRALKSPPFVSLTEAYPTASAFVLVSSMMLLGIMQLLLNDLYRGLKRMIALYNEPAPLHSP